MTTVALKPGRYVVLMGDLVGSEVVGSVQRLHRIFNAAVDWANARHGEHILSPLTITLGDEFQGLVGGLENAFLTAADLRFKLMRERVACRFVIGVVELRTRVNTERAWNMMGPGLGAARDKLNDKQSINAHRFSFPDNPAFELLTDAVGDSLTQIEAGWTDTQRDYFLRSQLMAQKPAAIAKSAKVSLRAVYKVLSAAQSDYYNRQASALRKALAIQDEQYGLA